jgi:hypothetical protein
MKSIVAPASAPFVSFRLSVAVKVNVIDWPEETEVVGVMARAVVVARAVLEIVSR